MPVKVRLVVDHLIDADDTSLTAAQVRDSVFQAHPTLAGGVIKVNGKEVKGELPLNQQQTVDPRTLQLEGTPITLKQLEFIHATTCTTNLKVEQLDGTVTTLTVGWDWTVRMLKNEIEDKLKVPAPAQKLLIDGSELGNHEILADKMASDNAIVKIAKHNHDRSFQIIVKTLTGKKIPIEVTLANTVYDLKSKVQDKEGLPPEWQRLIVHGKQLIDDNTLGFYGVYADHCVHLVLTLRGCGCGCGKNNYVEGVLTTGSAK